MLMISVSSNLPLKLWLKAFSFSVLKYHAEFQTVIFQISENIVNIDWLYIYFKYGFSIGIYHYIMINNYLTDTLDDFVVLG